MKVLVCGGRDFNDQELFDQMMTLVEDQLGHIDMTIVHGGASGADTMAGEWAKERGFSCIVYKADWKRHGKAAGPIRNRKMFDEERPYLVVAFPGGDGTDNMVTYAESKKVSFLFDLRNLEKGLRIVTPYGVMRRAKP